MNGGLAAVVPGRLRLNCGTSWTADFATVADLAAALEQQGLDLADFTEADPDGDKARREPMPGRRAEDPGPLPPGGGSARELWPRLFVGGPHLQNLRRGHYVFAIGQPAQLRVAIAFNELAQAIERARPNATDSVSLV